MIFRFSVYSLDNEYNEILTFPIFSVIATDGVHPAKARLIVHVDDVNDNDPEFAAAQFVFSIKEGSSTPPSSGRFIDALTAQDADSDFSWPITYSFVNGE